MKCKFSFMLLQNNSTYKLPMLRIALWVLRITLLFCLPAAPVLKQDAFILCLLNANNVSLGIYVISNDNVCLIRLMFVHRNVAQTNISMTIFNSSRPGQNGRHFTDDIFRCIFVNEKFCNLTKISLKFIPKGPIDNNPAMFFLDNGLAPNRQQLMLTWFADTYMRLSVISIYKENLWLRDSQ